MVGTAIFGLEPTNIEIGGGIVRELAETTQLDVRNKDTADGFDPQTNADVTTEVVISAVLRTLFPDVAIIGEEGAEGSEVETPTTDSDHAVRIQRACEEVSAKIEIQRISLHSS